MSETDQSYEAAGESMRLLMEELEVLAQSAERIAGYSREFQARATAAARREGYLHKRVEAPKPERRGVERKAERS